MRFAWIWIATSTSPAPTPTCFRRNIPPICPAAVWKSKCCRCRLQSLSISMVSLFKRSKARSAVRKSRQLMPTVPITSCVRFLTPICGTAACRVLQMSGWNRTRPLPCWTAFIRPSLCAIFWNAKNAEASDRSRTQFCSKKSFCF